MRVIRYFKTFFLERQYFYNNELFQCFFLIFLPFLCVGTELAMLHMLTWPGLDGHILTSGTQTHMA